MQEVGWRCFVGVLELVSEKEEFSFVGAGFGFQEVGAIGVDMELHVTGMVT